MDLITGYIHSHLVVLLIYQYKMGNYRRRREDGTMDNRFKGMTFVIIGRFSNLNYNLAKAMVQSLGGSISEKISSHVS